MSKRHKAASLVLELGSGGLKLGFADEEYPRKFDATPAVGGQENRAFSSHAVRRGTVVDWEALEATLGKALSSSAVGGSGPLSPKNHTTKKFHSLLVSTSMEGKEVGILAELIFEKFGFSALSVCSPAALVLTARGTSTGLVIDVGDGLTQITPVCEGYVQRASVRRLEIAGRDVTLRLADLMKRTDGSNYRIDGERDFEALTQIKEKFCYLASDLEEEKYICEKTNFITKSIKLPDGTEVVVGPERFLAPELLFQPRFGGDANSDLLGIAGLVMEAVAGCPLDLRADLHRSILLAGGSSLLNGFAARLEASLDTPVWIDQDPDRQWLAFRGGAMLASLNEGESEFWKSKTQFAESGRC